MTSLPVRRKSPAQPDRAVATQRPELEDRPRPERPRQHLQELALRRGDLDRRQPGRLARPQRRVQRLIGRRQQPADVLIDLPPALLAHRAQPSRPSDRDHRATRRGRPPRSYSPSCQGVRMRGPAAVTATVNSKWAAREPSWEYTAQPSLAHPHQRPAGVDHRLDRQHRPLLQQRSLRPARRSWGPEGPRAFRGRSRGRPACG